MALGIWGRNIWGKMKDSEGPGEWHGVIVLDGNIVENGKELSWNIAKVNTSLAYK